VNRSLDRRCRLKTSQLAQVIIWFSTRRRSRARLSWRVGGRAARTHDFGMTRLAFIVVRHAVVLARSWRSRRSLDCRSCLLSRAALRFGSVPMYVRPVHCLRSRTDDRRSSSRSTALGIAHARYRKKRFDTQCVWISPKSERHRDRGLALGTEMKRSFRLHSGVQTALTSYGNTPLCRRLRQRVREQRE